MGNYQAWLAAQDHSKVFAEGSSMDVGAWLRGLGLDQYEAAFRSNHVDAATLPSLTAEDLKDIGIVSVGHRRRMLEAIAALRQAVGEPPRATGSSAAAARPLNALEPIGAERRQLTVLFCDLAGSTAISGRLDPEDLREVMAAFHRAMTEVVQQQEGYVAKFLGDGMLAYFGWPEAHEDDAERAVRAGLTAVEAVAGLRTAAGPLMARVGIATGLVVVGDLLGEGSARERGVVGETPNLAARLQGLAEPGTVVADAATRQLTGALFEWADLGEAAIRGLPEPVFAWRALDESNIESRFEALRSTEPGLPPIGRQEELDILLRRWRRAAAGEGQVVMISGEPGIGKSRLLVALQEALAGDSKVLAWYCLRQRAGTALYPIISRLERAAGLEAEDAPETRKAKLKALLAPGRPTLEEVSLIADLLGIPTAGRRPDLNPQQRRERTFAALQRRMEVLAARWPVLALFEDVHWADPTTIELLDLTVERIKDHRVLLVVTHRPEFRAPWIGQAHVTELHLGRLDQRDSAALVERIASAAGGEALLPAVVQEIVERTDGIPLFAEELTRAVLEVGGRADDKEASPAAAAPIVPRTLQAALAARLDWLGPAARQTAQVGAIIGREFGHDLLAAVLDVPSHDFGPELRRLEEAGLIHRRGTPPEASYTFRHVLLRDAAYGMLLREQRRALHARTVEAIGRLRPEAAEREPELLAWHCTRAGMAEPAVSYWRRAGELSVARYANREAVGHFDQALEQLKALAPGEDRDRLEAELRLAQAVPLIAVHGFGSLAVDACARRAKELSGRLPGWRGGFAAQRLVCNSCLMRDTVPRAMMLARELFSSAERSASPAQIAVACRAFGYCHYVAGELAEADSLLARSVTLADTLEDSDFVATFGEDPRLISPLYRGQVRGLMGYPETALHLVGEGLARAHAHNNPHAIAWSLTILAQLYALLRDVPEVERAAAQAVDLSMRHRFPQWLGFAQQSLGWALCHLGRIAKGMAQLEEGMRHMQETGAHLHTTKTHSLFAEACLLAGQPKAALDHLQIAHSHAESYGEQYLMAEIHRLRASALRAQGAALSECEGHLRAALDIARRQAARIWALRAGSDLARLWRDQGRTSEARELLAPHYGSFTEGFTFPDLVEAKALLQ